MRPEEMVGQTLDHYRLIGSLGHGGSAIVFLAEDVHLQREVAIKVFKPTQGETQDFLRRFEREARVLAQLDHPNILPVYDYGKQDGLAFLVMPRLAGGSLRDRLRQQRTIPPAETVYLMGQILNALQYAHDRGLIHRDIKPGNMLFKADGKTLLLADFGLVKVLPSENIPLSGDPSSLTAHAITGTPDYMAPEQIMGKVSQASDIYAIGVVLYEMLAGERPFIADNYMGLLMQHMYEPPRSLRAINPQISPALEAVVMQAMEKDPARRYRRPLDLQQALERAIADNQQARAARDLYSTTPTIAVDPSAISPQHPGTSNYERSTSAIPATPSHTDTRQPSAPFSPSGSPPSSAQTHPNSPVYLDQTVTISPRRSRTPLLAALTLIALVIVVSLGGVLYATGILNRPPIVQTPPPGGPSPNPTTRPTLPPTTAACPPAGAARAAITPPMTLGTHQNIIYIANEGTPNYPIAGTVKEREAAPGTQDVEIKKMPNTYISEAQVSQDGQWVLFTARVGGQAQLRMVRMDGQALQTLYCAPPNGIISNAQWSFNQKFIVFNTGPDKPTTYLLDTTSGHIQAELTSQSNLFYIPVTWLDETRIYMTAILPDSDAPPQNIYVLDTRKGASQHEGDLLKINRPPCSSFDSDFDSQRLLISTCTFVPGQGAGPGVTAGPSTITIQQATGGSSKLLKKLDQAVVMLRTVSRTTLLLLVENTSGDTANNGLWRINIDGTNLTRLTTDRDGTQSLCLFTQYSWSNVSRNGNLYALQAYNPQTSTYTLYYGAMSGGAPTQLAQISSMELHIAGWTNL